MVALRYSRVRPAVAQFDLRAVSAYMFWLMFRNVASDGFVFQDPIRPGVISSPGCILASPSWENSQTHVRQDYVYHWTRDAAVVAIELEAGPDTSDQPLIDYVRFSQTCQSSPGDFDRGAFLIDGRKRDWTNQSDGPALQTLAILAMFARLDASTQDTARAVVAANLDYLQNAYRNETFNLWEEEYGFSFFARAVQLRCLREIQANTVGIAVPGWAGDAVTWLENALQEHWNGTYYRSVIPAPVDKAPYDPNTDIIGAAIYGGVPVTDTRLLATAALVRQQWADPGSAYAYPINADDANRAGPLGPLGPLLGRYPGDRYDGDTDALVGDHPWAIATANFAELYYRLAHSIMSSDTVPMDALSAGFFAQVGVAARTTAADAATALAAAGDRMLHALVFHSNHLELSEQFDAVIGYEKSVSNLSWSYAAFLSAVRARDRL
jgi:glucoamylase